MLEALYFAALFSFVIVRIVNYKKMDLENPNTKIVTILMVVVSVALGCYAIYYLYYSDSYERVGGVPLALLMLVVSSFLSYGMLSVFAKTNGLLVQIVGVVGLLAMGILREDLYELKREREYDNGVVCFVSVVSDMTAEYEKNKMYLTVICDSEFGRMSFSEKLPSPSTGYGSARYRIQPNRFENVGYKIGDSVVFKMAVNKPFVSDVYIKKLNYAYKYICPVIKIGTVEYDYYSAINPDEYGVDVVWKIVDDNDTVLVHKNLKTDNFYSVCPDNVNKTYNWRKISDYGYYFQDKIYRKEALEAYFPKVQHYVEKYKERMLTK